MWSRETWGLGYLSFEIVFVWQVRWTSLKGFVSMDAQEQQYDVTALENEDEFEEFEVEEWDRKEEDPENEELWEQDWDDDAVNDDFSQKLKAMVSQ
eukprot:jgi/Picsp_1/3683/NSC_06520-R1_---NA---